ncbi:hypothetical protein Tco_1485836 [Tanacetum coccineum]
MSNLKFADSHNMVTFLAKPTKSERFEKIIDFLNANPIKYALTVNPTIYTSCIEQFWATSKTKTVNGEVPLQALVDGIHFLEQDVRSLNFFNDRRSYGRQICCHMVEKKRCGASLNELSKLATDVVESYTMSCGGLEAKMMVWTPLKAVAAVVA